MMFQADVSLNEQLISFVFFFSFESEYLSLSENLSLFSESFNLFECFLLPSSAVIFCFVDLCFVFNFVDLCFFLHPQTHQNILQDLIFA